MRLVLDSNEYIGGLGTLASQPSVELFRHLVQVNVEHEIFASRVLLEEVRRNLPPDRFKEFWTIVLVLNVVVLEDWEIAAAMHQKYIGLGLKAGDAAIAACAETAGAEVVITENRDFHGRSGLPFRPLRAEEFLREQGTGVRPA